MGSPSVFRCESEDLDEQIDLESGLHCKGDLWLRERNSIGDWRSNNGPWSALPCQLLENISGRLSLIEFLIFRSVCRGWWRASSGSVFSITWLHGPFVLLYGRGDPTTQPSSGRSTTCFLFNMQCPTRILPMEVPKLEQGFTAVASRCGWLLVHRQPSSSSPHDVNGKGSSLFFLNLFYWKPPRPWNKSPKNRKVVHFNKVHRFVRDNPVPAAAAFSCSPMSGKDCKVYLAYITGTSQLKIVTCNLCHSNILDRKNWSEEWFCSYYGYEEGRFDGGIPKAYCDDEGHFCMVDSNGASARYIHYVSGSRMTSWDPPVQPQVSFAEHQRKAIAAVEEKLNSTPSPNAIRGSTKVERDPLFEGYDVTHQDNYFCPEWKAIIVEPRLHGAGCRIGPRFRYRLHVNYWLASNRYLCLPYIIVMSTIAIFALLALVAVLNLFIHN